MTACFRLACVQREAPKVGRRCTVDIDNYCGAKVAAVSRPPGSNRFNRVREGGAIHGWATHHRTPFGPFARSEKVSTPGSALALRDSGNVRQVWNGLGRGPDSDDAARQNRPRETGTELCLQKNSNGGGHSCPPSGGDGGLEHVCCVGPVAHQVVY